MRLCWSYMFRQCPRRLCTFENISITLPLTPDPRIMPMQRSLLILWTEPINMQNQPRQNPSIAVQVYSCACIRVHDDYFPVKDRARGHTLWHENVDQAKRFTKTYLCWWATDSNTHTHKRTIRSWRYACEPQQIFDSNMHNPCIFGNENKGLSGFLQIWI